MPILFLQSHVLLAQFRACVLATEQKSNLNLHVRTAHLGLRPYVCDVAECGLNFSHKHVLLRHMRVVHGRRRGVGGAASASGAQHSGDDEESVDAGLSGDEDEEDDGDEEADENENEDEDDDGSRDEDEHDADADSRVERFGERHNSQFAVGSTASTDGVMFRQHAESLAVSPSESRLDAIAKHLQHEPVTSSLKRTHMAANS